MASLMPLSESVPRAAVDPLTVAMAPKLMGPPSLIVTQPNLSLLHLSVPPLLEVVPFPPQAAATMTRTAPRASPVRILLFFMFPPPWGWSPAPQSKVQGSRASIPRSNPLLNRPLLPHIPGKLQVSHPNHPPETVSPRLYGTGRVGGLLPPRPAGATGQFAGPQGETYRPGLIHGGQRQDDRARREVLSGSPFGAV